MSGEFCDTNVLVYAYDQTASEKRDQARQLVERLWESGAGVISVQVLQELYVTLTRKVPARLSPENARSIVADLATWRVIEPAHEDVLVAIDASRRWKVSFWDAMILIAAGKAGVLTLWSEDLTDGQIYDGVVVRNPFRASG
jgi:predicted nucleic acid-binding protein